jgi:hypothetical protein
MTRILNLIKLTREDSPIAFVLFPISVVVFLSTSLGYVALTIANH